jgi:hypothetical protein
MAALVRWPTAGQFRAALHRRFYLAERQGANEVEVTAIDLHREVGVDSDLSFDMRKCCSVMRGEMRARTDAVVFGSDDDAGKSLTIRYKVPRWPH